MSLQDEVTALALDELKAQGHMPRWDSNGVEGRHVSEAIERAQREAEKRNFQIMRALDGAKPGAESSELTPGKTGVQE